MEVGSWCSGRSVRFTELEMGRFALCTLLHAAKPRIVLEKKSVGIFFGARGFTKIPMLLFLFRHL